jgi:hypothetical protein
MAFSVISLPKPLSVLGEASFESTDFGESTTWNALVPPSLSSKGISFSFLPPGLSSSFAASELSFLVSIPVLASTGI